MRRVIILIIEIIVIVILGIILLNNFRFNSVKYPCYRAYKYSDGLIYIGDDKCISTILNKKENDYLVLDDRSKSNPDMKIYNSYKIQDEAKMKEIINILLAHEELRPSNWNRTLNSLLNEWDAHNKLYNLHIQRERTADVDLDNRDEDLYKNKLGISTIIKYYTRK